MSCQNENEMKEGISGLSPGRYSKCNHGQAPLFLSDPTTFTVSLID